MKNKDNNWSIRFFKNYLENEFLKHHSILKIFLILWCGYGFLCSFYAISYLVVTIIQITDNSLVFISQKDWNNFQFIGAITVPLVSFIWLLSMPFIIVFSAIKINCFKKIGKIANSQLANSLIHKQTFFKLLRWSVYFYLKDNKLRHKINLLDAYNDVMVNLDKLFDLNSIVFY